MKANSLSTISHNKPMNDVSKLMAKLAIYQMLPKLRREMQIDMAIESITCTLEEAKLASDLAEIRFAVRFYNQHQLKDESAITAWCQYYEMTIEQLKALAIRQFKIKKFQQQNWSNQITSYFLERKRQLDCVVYSLVRTKDSGLAQEFYFRLVDDRQPFANIASKYSEGSEAQTNGIIGPLPLINLHPIIKQQLAISQLRQISPPIRIDDWFVILRLERSIPARLDENMQQKLLDELLETWLKEQITKESQTTAIAAI